MMFYLIFRWVVYLICSASISKGSLYSPSPLETPKQQSNFLNSSPISQNNGDHLYSSWSQWTSCSVSCGDGISSRTRKCLKSTYSSRGVLIPLCHGEFEEHKLCKVKPCPKDMPSVQEFQCSQYNNRIIAGKFVKTWIPASGGPNPCELRCEAKNDHLVYSFGKVSNGTPCLQGACLDGRCLRIGCDDRLGSEVLLDMCGVCGGKNSSCVHYKDVFQGQPSVATDSRSVYHEIVSIPVEARNLVIHQTLGKNLLALQDRGKGIIFNGEQNMSKYGSHYEIAGSPVEYFKTSDSTEKLIVRGPLVQELYVLVLLRSHNPGIYYEYWVPKQSHHRGSQHPVQPIRTKPHLITKTTTLPTKPQSYNVPIFTSKFVNYHINHHPTKPAFAYGYGEKPFKGQEAPVFRHIVSSTTPPSDSFRSKPPVSYPSHLDPSLPLYLDKTKRNYNLRREIVPGYKPRYLKPEVDFYQAYRNVTRTTLRKPLDLPKDLPVQGDSGVSSSRHENTILNSAKDNKKQETFDLSPGKTEIKISKRGDTPQRKAISNGRLKYSFESNSSDKINANSSRGAVPEQLSINVLTLPDKSKTSVKKTGLCEPCSRIRNQTKSFCESDFVVRAHVLGYEFIQGETRYELDVQQSFKNTFSLLAKEYVWAPDTCRCPKLRQGKEYVIMGKSDSHYKKRESRLLVDKNSFVRTFNLKYARRLQKLRKDEAKKCKKAS